MNKHTKLFVGFLAALLMILIVGTISFSLNISKNSNQQDDLSETGLQVDGYEIFQDENDLYGVKDSAGNTLIEAEWKKLHFISDDYLAAYPEEDITEKSNTAVFGILDVSGNVVTPFAYSDIQVLFSSYYLAEFADTEQYIFYHHNFQPFVSVIWDACTWDETSIVLTKEDDDFIYSTNESDDLTLTEMNLSRSSGNVSFSVDANDADITLLSADIWIYVTDQIQKVLEILMNKDTSAVAQVTDNEHEDTILSILSQENQTILRTDRTVYLTTDVSSEGTAPTLTWQVAANVRIEEEGQKKQTISIIMEQDEDKIWVITDLQLE